MCLCFCVCVCGAVYLSVCTCVCVCVWRSVRVLTRFEVEGDVQVVVDLGDVSLLPVPAPDPRLDPCSKRSHNVVRISGTQP